MLGGVLGCVGTGLKLKLLLTLGRVDSRSEGQLLLLLLNPLLELLILLVDEFNVPLDDILGDLVVLVLGRLGLEGDLVQQALQAFLLLELVLVLLPVQCLEVLVVWLCLRGLLGSAILQGCLL